MPESPPPLAIHYHERTKYDPLKIASQNKQLDWENQPIPYKEYKIGNPIDLKPYLSSFDNQARDRGKNSTEGARLSELLYFSYGLTAKFETRFGSPLYLRAAPSAGGLYPAEVYLVSRGTNLLPPGLYNYQPRTHSLIHFWADHIWSDLQEGCFRHPALESTSLAITTTAVFYRSAWRYEDRAYRRIFLDTGHLLGNIELACALNNYRPHFISGFRDQALNQLLYLDSDYEGAITVISLEDLNLPHQGISRGVTALPSRIQTEYPQVVDGELLSLLHKATEINQPPQADFSDKLDQEQAVTDKYNFPFCLKVSTNTEPIHWGENLSGLADSLIKRRSTREYTGAEITKSQLLAILNFTYQPHDYFDQGLDGAPDYFALDWLETFVAVSGVTDLEEGCYYYAPKEQELRQIRFRNFRQELYYLCLKQNLGRDAAAVVFHTADLRRAIAHWGDRVYRYLHMDAGHLGQKLNLAAIHLGLGVSGIGGFFDDQVNELLGIPVDEAVIYITTLGFPRQW